MSYFARISAQPLHSKVLRSLGIEAGELSEKEKSIRRYRRDQVRSEFIPAANMVEMAGKIPGLGPPSDKAGEFVTPIPMHVTLPEGTEPL